MNMSNKPHAWELSTRESNHTLRSLRKLRGRPSLPAPALAVSLKEVEYRSVRIPFFEYADSFLADNKMLPLALFLSERGVYTDMHVYVLFRPFLRKKDGGVKRSFLRHIEERGGEETFFFLSFLFFCLVCWNDKASAQGEMYELIRHVEDSAKSLRSLAEQLCVETAQGKESLNTQVRGLKGEGRRTGDLHRLPVSGACVYAGRSGVYATHSVTARMHARTLDR